MDKHTPEKWEYAIGPDHKAHIYAPQGVTVASSLLPTHARRIVRCVNSHEALVETLNNIIPAFKAALIHAGSDEEFAEIRVSAARAALAQAEAD